MKSWTILENNKALLYRDWLPTDSGWPELDALSVEHLRLLDAREAASKAAIEVQRRHDAEDEERKEALKIAYREGRDPAEVSELTQPDQRRTELATAQELCEAATDALCDFLTDAIATLHAHRDDWFAELDDRAAEGNRKRAEARRLVVEADAAAADINRLRTWVDRSTGGRLGHYPYGQIVAIPADRLPPITSEAAMAAQRERDAAPGIELIA